MNAPFFHPAPRFCREAQLTESGVVLGDIVLAPLSRRANGAAELAVEGREPEIFALLSLARGRAIHPNTLHGLHGVAKSLAQGDNVGAVIRLAQIGLPPLRGPRDAEMLKIGATFLAKGVSPWTILQAAGIEGANVQLFKADWDESLHPRDPTGRFATTGASADQNGRENANKPDHRGPWSAAVDAASQWLQAPVPEYDQDTGEQVGTRPRWRAIATSPIVVGAAGAAALLGGEALLAPAVVEEATSSLSMSDILLPNGEPVGYIYILVPSPRPGP
ncbi:hypothetical protein CCR94_18805 [Rhodoblastus sphagnicola]|uniref:Uncharacterized protein n=1 Tax=Rhodoblastus sphagnicola TaxID=333368 RepID=A0A2S6N0H6_9HYPH|nr:hypothetical protein [Rhodoblastus sphagnicola]MBB4198585.1 hypothetical protein [Rhodoblastus sphagnicola]PPQ28098.1 hypothetical protein CCR94_18805 [Rhodoblastus sphagnicola]